jgi:thioredoxin-dependent peroxiredoxin
MKSVIAGAATILALAASGSALAALPAGRDAPELSAPGAHAGKVVSVDLVELLKQGPVVVYFFPSAFTDSWETKAFAEQFERFRAAGTSVIGVSRDAIDTLQSFSAEEAGGKFPMVSADEDLVNAWDVNDGAMFNTRTTYVVAPSGKIVFVHDDNDYSGHITRTLAFVEGLKE